MTKKKEMKTEFVIHPTDYPKPTEECPDGEDGYDVFSHGEDVMVRMLAHNRLTTCTNEIDELLNNVVIDNDGREGMLTAALELLTAEYDYWRKIMDDAEGEAPKGRKTYKHICTECKGSLTSKSGVLYWCEECSELYWEVDGTVEGRRGLSYGN